MDQKTAETTRHCFECDQDKPCGEFAWTHDRYGNPWRKVCMQCFDRVQDEISKFVFDASYAGESLEPEDY
jgi:hypothetical protein